MVDQKQSSANGVEPDARVTGTGGRRRNEIWKAISVIAITTIVLGVIGFWRGLRGSGRIGDPAGLLFLEAVYRTLQLFVLDLDRSDITRLPPELQVARILAPAATSLVAFKVWITLVWDQLGLVHVRRMRSHAIICGLGEKGLRLAEALRRVNHRVVVIELDSNNPLLSTCRERRISVLIGDARQPDLLQKAGLFRARYVFAMFGRDGENAAIAAQVSELTRGRTSRLTCTVQINDFDLWRALREEAFLANRSAGPLRLEFFNIFDTAARVLLNRFPPFLVHPTRRETPAHVLIVGLGKLGESLLVRAAREWRVRCPDRSTRPLITVVDREAESRIATICARHPPLAETVELIARTVDVESLPFQDSSIFRGKSGDTAPTVAFVCFARDELSIISALSIRRFARQNGLRFPIIARVQKELGLSRLAIGKGDTTGPEISPFGMLDEACSLELLTGGITETIARALHASYVATERANGIGPAENPSVVDWNRLPETLKEQNRQHAEFITVQVEKAGYLICPLTDWDAWSFSFPGPVVELLARAEHDRWAAHMRGEGYRLGPEKNHADRTHPCLIDWGDLPEEERDKDRHFVREWPKVLYLLGFEIQANAAADAPS